MEGRGRARGRARSTAGQQPLAAPGRGAPMGAWGSGNPMQGGSRPEPPRAPGPALQTPQQPVPWGPTQARPAAPPASVGRSQEYQGDRGGPQRTAPLPSGGQTVGKGNGGDNGHQGRGALRGTRSIGESKLSLTRLPNVSKQGTTGEQIILQTNYFRLEKRADWCIFQYRVDFAPELDVTFTKKKLFYTAISTMPGVGKGCLFDGTMLFTPYRISPDPKEFMVDSLTNPDDKIRITIKFAKDIDKSSYQYLQVYNLVVRKCMSHLKLQQIKRDYFDPGNKIVVAQLNLEMWPGMITSIRQHEADVLMCAEIKHKIVKIETALTVMRKLMTDRNAADWTNTFRMRMLNTIVLTDYNNKTYRVDDIDFDKSPNSSFKLKDESTVTFAEYYQQRYGLRITDMSQPLLVNKVRERTIHAEGGAGASGAQERTMLLIPEFCRMTGLTEQERTDRRIKEQLEQYMMPTPQARIENLSRFNNRLQTTPGCVQEMKNFELVLSKDILSLSARKLGEETLYYTARKSYSATAAADWTKNMRGNSMFRTAQIGTWALIYSGKDKVDVQNFYDHMVNAATGMQWSLGRPILQMLEDRGRPYDKNAIGNAIEKLTSNHPDMMFALFIVPSNRTDHYGYIKKKMTVDKGIPTQVVTARTCSHRSAYSIATKVVVQINCKLGGAPWSVSIPRLGPSANTGGVMICGYDVCHDPTNKSKSFGAFVASYDRSATAYFSSVHAHRDGQELSDCIQGAFVKALVHYESSNKALPDHILFYRDGVGDGQVSFVYDHERDNIIQQLASIYAKVGKTPAFRMILVNKRINTRFFHNGRNPPPGTIVDDVVTMPDKSDFFLISQCTTKGTVSPTYYSILGPDEFNLDSDRTQILTHRLCHQYYNWSGTVRVPAPCQYAHKLAFLAAQSLQRPPNEALNHLLHFL